MGIAKGIIIAFKKYTVQSLLFLFALICAFLTVRHCKYGLFFGCTDITYNNTFHKPCKIYQISSLPITNKIVKDVNEEGILTRIKDRLKISKKSKNEEEISQDTKQKRK